jgi:hypothetical protein
MYLIITVYHSLEECPITCVSNRNIDVTVHSQVLHAAALCGGEGDGTKLGLEPTGQLFLTLALGESAKSMDTDRYYYVLNNLAREYQRRSSAGRGMGSLSWTSSKKRLEKARFPLAKN